MKQYSLIIFFALIMLTGCSSKSSFPLAFEEFSMKIYDNEKQYTTTALETSVEGMMVLAQLEEKTVAEDTGFINSLLIIKTSTQSGITIKELAESNAKQLQLNLMQYKSLGAISKKTKCDDTQYSGYLMTFSYEIDKTPLYEGQYFLLDDDTIYILAFSSDEKKDLTKFTKSIETIECNK